MFPVPSPASTSVPMTQNSNGVIILITLLNILVYKLQQLQEAKFTEQTNHLSLSLQKLCRCFSLRDIQWATFNFHDELVIGQGGFGKVYKGIIDFGATTVAIKRLKSRSKQGSQEFLTEIEMLSKFQHSHLVSLLGYCDDCHEMILVYEYMPCGTLADHLHKRVRKGDSSSPPLSWEQRLKICIGAARGLDYLHTGTSVQHRVIHRDVKSSNILLDENMAAKISDFGLSKIGPSNQPFSTYVSTHVKGTPGYLDPYYFATHRLTRKSDVYGLGVVLFEALCGRPAVDNSLDEEQRGLAGWAQHCFKEGLLDQIIDPSIKGTILPNSLEAFVRVAIQCLHNSPKHRPTMAEVVVGLESALALQESGTIYTLVETPIANCDQVNVNANSLEEEIINDADGGHHDEQSPARKTFMEKIGLFLFGKARMFSGHSDAKPSRNKRSNNNWIMAPNLKMFTLAELRKATRGFRPDMRLGKGEFGMFYKGWVHENTYAPSEFGVGMAIAVKRLRPDSLQGFEEWQVNAIAQARHKNLVPLLGFCEDGEHRLLVYEYMANGTLADFLFGVIKPSWKLRSSIALGIARGLAYLHEECSSQIIHCNIKPQNILFDDYYNARISDFELTKLLMNNQSRTNTVIRGTKGYVAPDWFRSTPITVKVDVYSFGVLLLEIICCRHNLEDLETRGEKAILIDWAWDCFREGRLGDLVEKDEEAVLNELDKLERFVMVGIWCIQEDPLLRPGMRKVIQLLEGVVDVTKPPCPSKFSTSSSFSF